MNDFVEILDAANTLIGLDNAARAEAWASSALSVWREDDDPVTIDLSFVQFLETTGDERALAIALASRDLGAPEVRSALTALINQLHAAGTGSPPWASAVGTAKAVSAWQIVDHSDRSMGLAFEHEDGGQHTLMADISDDVLGSLVVGPPADDLFELLEFEDVVIEPREAAEVAAEIETAWANFLALPDPEPTEAYLINHLLAESRLRSLLGERTEALATVPTVIDRADDEIDPDERAELNAWASDILRRAVTVPDVDQPELLEVLAQPVRGEGTNRADRLAFRELEWADWLGAVIGLVRAGAGSVVDGWALVDYVNRCPEVTSSIPKGDRDRVAKAFDAAIVLWRDEHVVDAEATLTPEGAELLPAALALAWSPVAAD